MLFMKKVTLFRKAGRHGVWRSPASLAKRRVGRKVRSKVVRYVGHEPTCPASILPDEREESIALVTEAESADVTALAMQPALHDCVTSHYFIHPTTQLLTYARILRELTLHTQTRHQT